jgi:hypothetical protein
MQAVGRPCIPTPLSLSSLTPSPATCARTSFCLVVVPSSPSLFPRVVVGRSTRCPPCEQLLAAVGVGGLGVWGLHCLVVVVVVMGPRCRRCRFWPPPRCRRRRCCLLYFPSLLSLSSPSAVAIVVRRRCPEAVETGGGRSAVAVGCPRRPSPLSLSLSSSTPRAVAHGGGSLPRPCPRRPCSLPPRERLLTAVVVVSPSPMLPVSTPRAVARGGGSRCFWW